MNVTFACADCGQTVKRTFESEQSELSCSACGYSWKIPPMTSEHDLGKQCRVCPSTDLFIRKDFSHLLGLAIVVLGFAISCVTWYFYLVLATFAVLFATALIDIVLYFFVGNVLPCYRCHAEYRDLDGLDHLSPFNLETHERYRQEAARLRENERSI